MTVIVAHPTEAWFDNLVATLRSHQVQLESGVAAEELKDFYQNAMSSDVDKIVHGSKMLVQQYFVKKILLAFFEALNKQLPNKLAFDFNDSSVLVWAEIKDDDEAMEDILIMTEAKVNATFHQYGFDIKTTIVERSDNLSIPSHYSILKA